jgi:predicted O-methyltransferase YrrM
MLWRKNKSIKDLLPPPVDASHREYSMILSAHDEKGRANAILIDLSLKAIAAARQTDLSFLSQRLPHPPFFPDTWPGEHYKLLAGFIQVLKPKLAIEIGTSTGLSALAMASFLSAGGRLVTYDVKNWRDYPNTALKEEDFSNLTQVVGDLSQPDFFREEGARLRQAEWIFIDATHDGHLEKKLLDLLGTLSFEKPPFLLFDDIRVWTMLKMWREISYPKLDLTSFGHWSGTGLVHLADPLAQKNGN